MITKVKLFIGVFLLLWCAPLQAAAPDEVKISLFTKYHPKRLLVEPAEPYLLNGREASGPLDIILLGSELEISGSTAGQVVLEFAEPWVRGRINSRQPVQLPSKVTITIYEGELAVTGRVAVEEYVAAVVQAELGQGPPAALAAQAILVRTYLAANAARHRVRGADLCDLTHCQVYRAGPLDAVALSAALETKGLILTDNKNQPAQAFYSSTCGGQTVAPETVWPGSSPDLIGVSDYLPGEAVPLCLLSPHQFWQSFISKKELRPLLEKIINTSLKDDYRLAVYEERAGLVMTFELTTATGRQYFINEQQLHQLIGRNLGWQRLKSATYTLTDAGEWLFFNGRGLGHQVGLCQYGARELARRGYSAEMILKHYFPRLKLLFQ